MRIRDCSDCGFNLIQHRARYTEGQGIAGRVGINRSLGGRAANHMVGSRDGVGKKERCIC